jgi:AraC-like DNA-binding protein
MPKTLFLIKKRMIYCNKSFSFLLFFLFAVACTQPPRQGNEDIEEALNNAEQLLRINPDSSLLLLSTLWNENRGQFTERNKFVFYNMQGNLAVLKGSFDTVEDWYLKALKTAEGINDTLSQARALVNIGSALQHQSKTQAAVDYFRRAQVLLGSQTQTALDDAMTVRVEWSANSGLANNFARMAQMDSAFHYAQTALDLAVKGGFRAGEALSLNDLSMQFQNLKEHRQAEEYLQKAISIFEELNDVVNLRVAYNNLTITLTAQNRMGEAELAAQKSDEIAKSIGVPTTAQYSILNQRGVLLFEEKDYAGSLKMHYKALELANQQSAHMNDPLLRIYSIYEISRTYRQLRALDKAILYASEALEIAQKSAVVHQQIYAYRNLAHIYAVKRDIEQFECFMEIERNLRDSLFTEQNAKILRELQIKYETEQKKLLIVQQEKDIQHKVITIILLAIICFFIVLVSLFQRRKIQNITRIVQQYETIQKNKKEARQLAEEKVADSTEKLAADLQHLFETEKIYRTQNLSIDDVAKMLSTKTVHLSQVISRVYLKNFSEYVNTYRVGEAAEMLKEQNKGGKYAHLTIQAVAEAVGFSSRTPFYAAFKQVVGVTPSEYKRVLSGGK